MFPDKAIMCHRTGFEKSCLSCVVEHRCQLWTQIVGTDPQTGVDVNRYGCADSFMPLLMIENSQMQRQTGAAVESLRNVVARSGGVPPAVLEPDFRRISGRDKDR